MEIGLRKSGRRPGGWALLALAGMLAVGLVPNRAEADPSGVAAAIGAGVVGLFVGSAANEHAHHYGSYHHHHFWNATHHWGYPVYVGEVAPVVHYPVSGAVVYSGAYPVMQPYAVSSQPMVYVRPTY